MALIHGLIIIVLLSLSSTVDSECLKYKPIVVGSMWELSWIQHILSGVEDLVPQPSPSSQWEQYSDFTEFNSHCHDLDKEHPSSPLLLITNLFDPNLLNMFRQIARNDPRTALVAVDEMQHVTYELCVMFQFVIRVGFSVYPTVENGHHYLWKQPNNTLLVPLGVSSPFMDSLTSMKRKVKFYDRTVDENEQSKSPEANYYNHFISRTTKKRYFLASYAGRSQNINRQNTIRSIDEIGRLQQGFIYLNDLGNVRWGDGLVNFIKPEEYLAVLADSVLAPSPPGNNHPECYRTYEAIEAGAIPVVDNDYYRYVFGASDFIEVSPDSWNLTQAIYDVAYSWKVKQIQKKEKEHNLAASRKKHFEKSLLIDSESDPISPNIITSLDIEMALEEKSVSVIKWWEKVKLRAVSQASKHVRYLLKHSSMNLDCFPNVMKNDESEKTGSPIDCFSAKDEDGHIYNGGDQDFCRGVNKKTSEIGSILSEALLAVGLDKLDGVHVGGGPWRVVENMLTASPSYFERMHLIGPWHVPEVFNTYGDNGGDVRYVGEDAQWDLTSVSARLSHFEEENGKRKGGKVGKLSKVRFLYAPSSRNAFLVNKNGYDDETYYFTTTWINEIEEEIEDQKEKYQKEVKKDQWREKNNARDKMSRKSFYVWNGREIPKQTLGSEVFGFDSLGFVFVHVVPQGDVWFSPQNIIPVVKLSQASSSTKNTDPTTILDEQSRINEEESEKEFHRQHQQRVVINFGESGFIASLESWWPKIAPGGILCGSNYVRTSLSSGGDVSGDYDAFKEEVHLDEEDFNVRGALERWAQTHQEEIVFNTTLEDDKGGLKWGINSAESYDISMHLGGYWWLQKKQIQ